jgi:hypothetical protein
MARVERIEDIRMDLEEARMNLEQVREEASYVERLAAEVRAERLGPGELPALLENLGARLVQLASPKNRWRGLPRVVGG